MSEYSPQLVLVLLDERGEGVRVCPRGDVRHTPVGDEEVHLCLVQPALRQRVREVAAGGVRRLRLDGVSTAGWWSWLCRYLSLLSLMNVVVYRYLSLLSLVDMCVYRHLPLPSLVDMRIPVSPPFVCVAITPPPRVR